MERLTRLLNLILCSVVCLGAVTPAFAHPAPFSFVDMRVDSDSIGLEVVVHAFDVAYELGIEPPDKIFEVGVLGLRSERLTSLLTERLQVTVDGRRLLFEPWSRPEPLPERQSLRFRTGSNLNRAPGSISVSAGLFPYDDVHQTFLNIYDDGALTSQAILGGDQASYEYFVGSHQGVLAVIRKFVPAGVHHILIGPDHLLFLVGLLLLGGGVRRLLLIITGFTFAHSLTLALAVLSIFTPPGRLVEPIIALSIVYVGADNLLVRGGRDLRVWIAVLFGLIHGFGFASVLREMGLPSGALGWSLFSFNLGVEIGQIAIAVTVATGLMMLRAHSDLAGRRVTLVGSIVVMAAGAFWFVQRVFFFGGMA